MSSITTDVLDTTRGRPAGGVPVVLEHATDEGWERVGHGETEASGRMQELAGDVPAGRYRLVFDTSAYLPDGFYPEVVVQFTVAEDEHYHVPLLLSPFGYSTFRGS